MDVGHSIKKVERGMTLECDHIMVCFSPIAYICNGGEGGYLLLSISFDWNELLNVAIKDKRHHQMECFKQVVYHYWHY